MPGTLKTTGLGLGVDHQVVGVVYIMQIVFKTPDFCIHGTDTLTIILVLCNNQKI